MRRNLDLMIATVIKMHNKELNEQSGKRLRIELETKRSRLQYHRIHNFVIRRMINFLNLLFVFLISLLVYSILCDTTLNPILVSFYIFGITIIFNYMTDNVRMLIETEKEIYEICAFIKIYDELEDNEIKLYDWFTGEPNLKRYGLLFYFTRLNNFKKFK